MRSKRLRDSSPSLSGSRVELEREQSPCIRENDLSKRVRFDTTSGNDDNISDENNSENDRTVSMRVGETPIQHQLSSNIVHTQLHSGSHILQNEPSQGLSGNRSTPLSSRRPQRARVRDCIAGSTNIFGTTQHVSTQPRSIAPQIQGSIPGTYEELRPAFNNLKASFIEVQHAKRAFVSTVISHKGRIDPLQK